MEMRNATRADAAQSLPPAKKRKCNNTRAKARTVQIRADKREVRKRTPKSVKPAQPEGDDASSPAPALIDSEPSSPVHAGGGAAQTVTVRCRVQSGAPQLEIHTKVLPLEPHSKALQELNTKIDAESKHIPGKAQYKYQDFKGTIQSLHTAIPSSLLCRENELATLSSFLKTTVGAKVPGSLYVSGPPGTGKTACITHLLQGYKDSPVAIVNVNCMGIQRPQAIFARISSELLVGGNKSSETAESMARLVVSSKKMILIVLDEIDQLVQRGQEVLYTLFEWPSLPGSKVILVGIANSLDFTDRFLPRLQSHLHCCHPQLLQFRPYTKDEIVAILHHRLGDTGAIEPKAIEFCARKVSAVFGDLRKALDLCQRAVELAQAHGRSRPLEHNQVENPSHLCVVTMKEMATVVASDMATSLKDDSLPFQQKLVVCTLVVLVRGKPSREVSLAQLQDAYRRVCERRQLKAEGDGELVALCSFLETMGIITVKGKRGEPRLAKIILKLQESEVEQLLKDKTLLSTVLSEGI